MKNASIVIFLFLLFVLQSAGQESGYTKIKTPEETQQKLIDASKKVTSISCDFTQKKELSILSETIVSEGVFKLKGSDKLMWAYKTPYLYKIIINGDKMEIDNADSKMTFDTRSNRMFREISTIMIKSVDGSIVNDHTTFDTELFENENDLLAVLKPKTKELGALFQKINLHFNKSNYLVSQIEMYEELGDVTTIILKNQKLNEAIEDKVFCIDN